ncbi:MAG: hypothetical protein ACYDG5_03515, partial [Dehalococcoidales bacterium]
MSEDNKKKEDNKITLGSNYLSNLTEAAKDTFQKYVVEYAERLKREAENIENMEHTGQGPPEITGAHLEEAKYVSLRRMRRKALSQKKHFILRFFQLSMTAVAGVGASNFSQI